MLEKLKIVPKKPGIYIWKDKNGLILYIGKAKVLQNRMKSYFKSDNPRTIALVSKISDFEYIITNNEHESLVLERNLIEKELPPFNVLLKDNKKYPYLKLSYKDKPRVSLVYRVMDRRDKSSKYYGPFPVGSGVRALANYIEKDLIYENGLIAKHKSRAWYKERYENALSLLEGKRKNIFTKLIEDMEKYASNEQYELALELREILKAFTQLSEGQVVEISSERNVDFIGFYSEKENIFVTILHYRYGKLISKEDFVLPILLDKANSVTNFINQYYWSNIIPNEIYSNWEVDSFVEVKKAQKGINKKAISIAIENSKDNMELKLSKFKKNEDITINAFNTLKEKLGLEKLNKIVMVDNSNTANTYPISAFVVYKNGKKSPREYRKYRLKEVLNRKADVEYMRQGILKYFEKNDAPDLLIVDGGKPQVFEAKKILPNQNIIGLVKDDKHRTRSIVDAGGKEIIIADNNLFLFLSAMQLEVDRYAKFYHRKRKSIGSLEGELTKISGIGLKTEIKLLNHFKTYSNIFNASIEELSKVVSTKVAKDLKDFIK